MEPEQENASGAHNAGARPFDTSPRMVAFAIVDDEVEPMWLNLPIGPFTIIVAVTTIINIDAGPPSSELV